MTITVLIVINVFAAAGIIALVLLQQGKSDVSSAFGGGGSQSMFGSRGSANFLSRATSILTAVFFLSSLTLAYMYAQRDEQRSVTDGSAIVETVEQLESAKEKVTDNAVSSEVPAVPGSVVDETQKTDEINAVETETSGEVPAVPE